METEKMAYEGKKPYAFISYSHTDRNKIEKLLRMIYSEQKKFWYDGGIGYSSDWEAVINERLENSAIFILFLSNGTEQRPQVIREIRMAIEKRKETNGKYRVFVVMLERVPIDYVFKDFPDILTFLQSVQYISVANCGGYTVRFRELITSRAIWQYCEDETSEKDTPDSRLTSFAEINKETGYVYPYASPEMREENEVAFFGVNIGETDPNTVYPICMDDEWCPQEMLHDPRFEKDGFLNRELKAEREKMQQTAIITALLHNRQIVINRASVFNTDVLADWYMSEDENVFSAFVDLLENGTFVIYLMYEKSPVDRPKFSVKEERFARWKTICEKHKVYCIRMSWNDMESDEANRFEITKKLSVKMQNLFLTTASDEYRIESFIKAFCLPADQKKPFSDIWRKIRDAAIAAIDQPNGSFSRRNFYQKFLIEDEAAVSDYTLDFSKPFVRELKQIVDYNYTVNLPMALEIRPVSPYNNILSDYMMYEKRGQEFIRTISTDELFCAVLTFNPAFLEKTYFNDGQTIDLCEVAKIRTFEEWRGYMEALDASRKRAKMNELDLYDIETVWKRYAKLMDRCQKALPAQKFEKQSGCLSVIFHFGSNELISVYSSESDTICIKRNATSQSMMARENVTIDFACGDIIRHSDSNNCFIERIRLFEGVLLDSAQTVYERIFSALTTHNYTEIKDDKN